MAPQAFQKLNRGRFTGQHEFLVLEQRSGSETQPATLPLPAGDIWKATFPLCASVSPPVSQYWHYCPLQAV